MQSHQGKSGVLEWREINVCKINNNIINVISQCIKIEDNIRLWTDVTGDKAATLSAKKSTGREARRRFNLRPYLG